MVEPDLIPVWVGVALLGTFALLTVLACAYCGVCLAVDVAKETHDG